MWPIEELRDACRSGDVARVSALICQHRGVATRHFDNLVSFAAKNGHADVVDALIDGVTNQRSCAAALQELAAAGFTAIVEKLLARADLSWDASYVGHAAKCAARATAFLFSTPA